MRTTRFATLSLLAALGTAAAGSYASYRREMNDLRRRLLRGSRMVETASGPIEYAETGNGDPLLLIHGAGGGYDQGLLIGRELADTCRIIAPSRFGYLRTPLPVDASPAAQAEAHAALLDRLQIKTCIIAGVSAGAPSAIEFALRYPERTRALLLIVPRTYDPSQAIGPDRQIGSRLLLGLIESSADYLTWVAMRVARPAVVRFLGIRPELEARAAPGERERVNAIMRSLLPLTDRVPGIEADSATVLAPSALDQVQVPTLIISAKDDLFRTLPGATFTAERIDGADLRVLDNGGHLMVGQTAQVRAWIMDFLDHRVPKAKARKTSAEAITA